MARSEAALAREAFYRIVTDAVNDLLANGYDSQKRLEHWLQRIELAARAALVPEGTLRRVLGDALQQVYERAVGGGLVRRHAGVSQFTLDAIKPKLRRELDRRILASADLIRLNREASIQRTLQRFAGWATSIPIGGTDDKQRKEAKRHVRRGIAALPFEERRVIIDQGHKLAAAIDDVVATDAGAIAGTWRSRWREAGYDYREDHKDRDGKVYVLPGNWALDKGLVRLAGAQYTDEVTAPGEEINCRCRLEYVYALRDLPVRMLTVKGRAALTEARRQIRTWDSVHNYHANQPR
jgi:hypothetical protein